MRDRGLVLAEEPLVAPLPQRREHGPQLAAHVGEHVVAAPARLLVRAALHHAGVDERVESRGEDVAGDAEPVVELLEAGDAEERVAEDQRGPPLADDLERLGDAAVHVGEGDSAHVTHATDLSCVIEPSDRLVCVA